MKFRCPNCSQKLLAKDSQAGWIRTCPRCKRKIAVPEFSTPKAVPGRSGSDDGLLDLPKPDADIGNPFTPAPRQVDDDSAVRLREQEVLASAGMTPPPEHTGERRVAWPIDVLLYPANTHGLVFIGIVVGVPFLMALFRQLIPLLGMGLGIIFLIVSVIIALYAGWYFAECVYDSAKGGTRAPDVFVVGVGDMWSRFSYLLGVYILFAAPVGFYYGITQKIDWIFWGLLAWALVFFPIGLLAMVAMDSTTALNPLFLLGSIFRVFVPYLGLVLVLGSLGVLIEIVLRTVSPGDSMGLDVIELLISVYGALIMAHVLGRFYWRHSERLDWGL